MPVNVLLLAVLAAAPAATRSACITEVVAPAVGPREDALVAWLAAHDWEGAHLLEEGRFRGEVRIADIDDDGAEEYVLSVVEGSART